MTTAKPEKASPIHPDDLLGWSDLQYDPFCFVESWSLKLPTLVGQTKYIIGLLWRKTHSTPRDF
jgi:hypothetical protein